MALSLVKRIKHKPQSYMEPKTNRKESDLVYVNPIPICIYTQTRRFSVGKAEINYTSLWRPTAEKRLNNWRRWIWSVIRRLSAGCFIAEVSQVGTDGWGSRAVCPPDPVKPPQCVERSVADVQGGMNLSEVFLSHQRQATDAKVGVKRVRMTVRPFSKTAHQTVLRRQNVVPVLFKVCVLEDI